LMVLGAYLVGVVLGTVLAGARQKGELTELDRAWCAWCGVCWPAMVPLLILRGLASLGHRWGRRC
jgi:hypothetical protein